MNISMRSQSGFIFFFALLVTIPVIAQQESVVLDPQSGNYIVTYEYDGQLDQEIYVPPNKIQPDLESTFKLIPSGDITYRYRLRNGKDSRQNIVSFALRVTSAKGASTSTDAPDHLQRSPTAETALALSADSRKVALTTPSGWDGSVLPNPRGTGLDIWWSEEAVQGLLPGKSQGGFGYESQDLPGIGMAGMAGKAPILAFKGEGPGGDVGDQLSSIMRETSGVTRPVAVPTFSVPAPFDASILLSRLQKHTKVDLVAYKLIDPVLAAQLDPWFTAAIDSVKRSNAEGTHHAIKELRHLLKQECSDLDKEGRWDDKGSRNDEGQEKQRQGRIDRLAARVLDFDLRYVESRIKGEDSDER